MNVMPNSSILVQNGFELPNVFGTLFTDPNLQSTFSCFFVERPVLISLPFYLADVTPIITHNLCEKDEMSEAAFGKYATYLWKH